MVIGKVIKKVVSTVKNSTFDKKPLLLVQPVDLQLKAKGEELLTIDFMGADIDELVLVVKEGSSVNDLLGTSKAPADAAIIGIIDTIDLKNKIIFEKSSFESAQAGG
ncbi:MAG: EutN/CcmL family microcompartment protein [Candidatus Rifleibacteriota bacterium]